MYLKLKRFFTFFVLLGMLLPSPVFAAGQAYVADPSPTIFINEIHYDNVSTDTGEAVEIAGPAGTDLSGWSLVLYNGNGGAPYTATTLSGVIPDQQNGYGTVYVSYPPNGLQNGNPDGLALVAPGDNVVMFLSYGGSFDAVGGPADGLTSTDIGVTEGSSTPVGDSLQLTGTGTTYGDFTWAASQPATFDAINTGQTFSAPVNEPVNIICGGTLTLTEGVGGSTSVSASDLDGLVVDIVISDVNPPAPITLSGLVPAGAAGEAASALVTIDASTPIGSYLVTLNAANDDAVPQTGTCDLSVEVLETPTLPDVYISEIHYDNDGTDSGEAVEVAGPAGTDLTGWSLVLYNGSNGTAYTTTLLSGILPDQKDGIGTMTVNYPVNGLQNGAPDGLALIAPDATVVEFLSYEGSFTGVGDPADGVISTDIGVAEGSSTPVGYSLQLIDSVWVGPIPNTFGTINHLPYPKLVINEIDYDQPSTDTAEFLEIRNNEPAAVNLDNWTVELVNGENGGAVVYQEIDLPDVSLAAGGYYVICANATTVPNCDLDGSPNTDFLQNGSPDAVGLRFDGELIDAVSYEGNTGAPYTEGSGVDLEDTPDPGKGISRCPDGVDTDQNNVDFILADITPGTENTCEPPPPPEVCGDPFTPIYEVQGSGFESPLKDTEVTVEGIVTGDFQLDSQLKAFYMQDPTGDGNPDTSDGILVYLPATSNDVNVGDHVRIRGFAKEYYDMTEIANISMFMSCSSGNVITPTPIDLPVTAISDFEAYEGMLVTFPDTLYIDEYYAFAQYGEIVLGTSRQYTWTAIYEPGSAEGAQMAQENLLSRIKLDDGRTSQNPDPALHPNGGIFNLSNLFRGGDELRNVTGVLDYNFGEYKLQLTTGAEYIPANPRPAQPDDTGGSLKVSGFNVLNFFTTLGSRGADTPEEFDRQRTKIIAALSTINADVVGLTEIENNTEAIQNLVDGLNALMGADTYAYIDTGIIGTDEIKIAFIYKPASVSLIGNYAILDTTVDPRFIDTKNRPALAQTFQDNTTGGIFTVAVNHLKSKGSDCNDLDDPDLGDGAGNCNLTRKAAAEALVDWLATDPTGSGDPDFIIMGDLNSYDKEDPIDAIKMGSDDTPGTSDDYTDLLYHFIGEYAYSYVFDGQLGYLDYSLANSAILPEVSGATVWHINTDEPGLIDYDMTYKKDAQDLLYEPNAYRSSDHDPVIIGLNICDEIAPTMEVSVTPDQLWPANHKYVTVQATVTAADNFDPNPTITLVSVTSNEPDNEQGNGDGNTVNDIVILDDFTFQLRAERSAQGTGRIYTITYQVTDACGNVSIQSATVTVPKSMKK